MYLNPNQDMIWASKLRNAIQIADAPAPFRGLNCIVHSCTSLICRQLIDFIITDNCCDSLLCDTEKPRYLHSEPSINVLLTEINTTICKSVHIQSIIIDDKTRPAW